MARGLVLLAPGFEEIEATTVIDILRRSKVEVTLVGLGPGAVEGAHGIRIMPERSIGEVSVKEYDAIILPGGAPGYENLRRDGRVIEMVKEAHGAGKLVAAICASPAVLSDAGILKGKRGTIYPGMEEEIRRGGGEAKKGFVVIDGNVITSMGPATAIHFALTLAERLAGKDVAEGVRRETLADMALRKG